MKQPQYTIEMPIIITNAIVSKRTIKSIVNGMGVKVAEFVQDGDCGFVLTDDGEWSFVATMEAAKLMTGTDYVIIDAESIYDGRAGVLDQLIAASSPTGLVAYNGFTKHVIPVASVRHNDGREAYEEYAR